MYKLYKKILILGADGMLGSDIVKILSQNYNVFPLTIQNVDIADKETLERLMKQLYPDIVINCAAYTNVDGAETNPEKAFSVNAEGVKHIAECCNSINARMIHYSTDYIFDGNKKDPYNENDTPCPLNIYGQSKLKGEEYIKEILADYLIIRSSWLFGEKGKNFVNSILKLSQEKEELKIVNDQVGSPTYTSDLSKATGQLIEKDIRGIVNVTNSGYCSWFTFSKEITELSNISIKIKAIRTEELNRSALRPKNSILDCSKFNKLTGSIMPSYKSALKSYLKEINQKVEVFK
jgi:dTDP-4-dehydrorhamnose reductase